MAEIPETWLVLAGINGNTWSHKLNHTDLSIGREESNDVRVSCRSVSRHHARISRGGRTYLVQDLGSSNGTFVNEKRLDSNSSSSFEIGDTVRFGRIVVEVLSREEAQLRTAKLFRRGTEQIVPAHADEVAPGRNGSGQVVDLEALLRNMEGRVGLSNAERRVFRMLIRTGHSEREIAEALLLSQHTVHSHAKHIYKKFEVNSRNELAARVFDLIEELGHSRDQIRDALSQLDDERGADETFDVFDVPDSDMLDPKSDVPDEVRGRSLSSDDTETDD